MSVDTLHAFYRAFREDGSFLRLFNNNEAGLFASSMVALGKENGFEFEEGDVMEALKNPDFFLKEALGDEELSDAELAVMAGGVTLGEHTTVLGGVPDAAVAGLSATGSSVANLLNQTAQVLPDSGSSGSSGGTSGSTGGTSSKG